MLNLADAIGVTVVGARVGYGEVDVQLDDRERAREFAAAIDGEPTVRHYPPHHGDRGMTTWTATHRGVPVIVYGTYAGPEEVAS